MNVLEHLEDIEKKYSSKNNNPLLLKNSTFHLCMEDRFLSVFTDLWISNYKPCAFTIRDAKDGVYGSIVVSIRDIDGELIEFIAKVIQRTQARVVVKK